MYTANSTISRTPQTTHTRNLEFVRSTRVPSKLPKVPADPYSEHNIPRVCSGLSNGRNQPPKFQGQEYSEGSTPPPHTTSDYFTSTGAIHWKAVSSDPGSPPSPTSLPKHTVAQTQGTCIGRLRPAGDPITEGKGGHNLVDSTDARLEWQKDAGLTTTICDQDRCIPEGLGSLLLWNIYRGMLVTGGGPAPHQCPQDASCSLWDQVICEGRSQGKNHPHQVRQYNSGVLSESHGGYKVSNTDRDGSPGVGMVPLREHNLLSPVSTRVGECQSRLSLLIPNRQNRLAPQPNNIPGNQPAVGTPGSTFSPQD